MASRPSPLRALTVVRCAMAFAALGCKADPPPAADSVPAPVPSELPAAAPAGALDAVELARLEFLFESASLLGQRWPWLANDETCVLLLAPRLQWILNCDEPPAGFVPIAERFRGQPVFERRASSLRSAGRELDTGTLLASLPAAAHVDEPGARASELSPRHPWLLVGTLAALVAHHEAFREASTDEWLSVALHELFHARQLRAPGFAPYLAAINRKQLDPAPLEQRFRDDPAYRTRVEREYALLVSAVRSLAARAPQPNSASARMAREQLARWYALYRQRRAQLHSSELIQSDRLFTFVEGVARYVESTYLEDASLQPHAAIAGDPRFFGFARYAGRGYAHMQNRQLDPTYWYAIGFHVALLLDHADPGWKGAELLEEGWLIGRVERLVTPRGPTTDRVAR